MNTNTVEEKIYTLNKIIKSIVKTEPEGVTVALICLSARGVVYLRNNNIDKLEEIETEIDEAINTYEMYSVELKLPV